MERFQAVIVVALLFTTAARADDLRYLPNKPQLIVSVDVAAFLKSKTYQELKNLEAKETIPPLTKELEREIREGHGIPVSDVARVTFALKCTDKERVYKSGVLVSGEPEFVGVVTTIKPFNPAELLKTIGPFKNGKYETSRIDSFTVYSTKTTIALPQPPDKDGKQPGKPITIEREGPAVCFPDDKTIVIGSLPVLTAVLGRTKAGELSANVKVGLKEAPFSSPFSLVGDLQNLPERTRKELFEAFKDFPIPGVAELLPKVQLAAVSIKEGEKLQITKNVFFKDEADAAEAKKTSEKAMKAILDKLKEEPKGPHAAEMKPLMESLRKLIESVQISTSGNQLTATASIDPAQAARGLAGLFYFMLGSAKSETKEAKPTKNPTAPPARPTKPPVKEPRP